MNKNDTNLVLIILLLAFTAIGCSFLQKQVNKATTKTISASQMCDNEGQTVRVFGFVGATAIDTDNIIKDGKIFNSFYFFERRKTPEESKADYERTKKIEYPKERVVLRRGFDEKTQILTQPTGSYDKSTIKTDNNEVVPITEQLAFTGKVVMTQGNTNPPGACQMEDVSIAKP